MPEIGANREQERERRKRWWLMVVSYNKNIELSLSKDIHYTSVISVTLQTTDIERCTRIRVTFIKYPVLYLNDICKMHANLHISIDKSNKLYAKVLIKQTYMQIH